VDPAAVLGEVGGAVDGAVILFLGVVRNHAEGRAVRGMRYEAYRAMAEEVLAVIVAEAAARLGAREVVAVHRVGELTVGEVSVAIAAASPHRAEAFDAARYVIEEIKKRLPVWKREHYVDGEDRWVEGTTPPTPEGGEAPGEEAPRTEATREEAARKEAGRKEATAEEAEVQEAGGGAGGRDRSAPYPPASRVEPASASAAGEGS
jgi:molybdopterin synthase catalytic subunit